MHAALTAVSKITLFTWATSESRLFWSIELVANRAGPKAPSARLDAIAPALVCAPHRARGMMFLPLASLRRMHKRGPVLPRGPGLYLIPARDRYSSSKPRRRCSQTLLRRSPRSRGGTRITPTVEPALPVKAERAVSMAQRLLKRRSHCTAPKGVHRNRGSAPFKGHERA